jgi:hypothetical protein
MCTYAAANGGKLFKQRLSCTRKPRGIKQLNNGLHHEMQHYMIAVNRNRVDAFAAWPFENPGDHPLIHWNENFSRMDHVIYGIYLETLLCGRGGEFFT